MFTAICNRAKRMSGLLNEGSWKLFIEFYCNKIQV